MDPRPSTWKGQDRKFTHSTSQPGPFPFHRAPQTWTPDQRLPKVHCPPTKQPWQGGMSWAPAHTPQSFMANKQSQGPWKPWKRTSPPHLMAENSGLQAQEPIRAPVTWKRVSWKANPGSSWTHQRHLVAREGELTGARGHTVLSLGHKIFHAVCTVAQWDGIWLLGSAGGGRGLRLITKP